MTLLEVNDLHAGYGDAEILRGLSFSLKSGCTAGILGINGCGKSTLMKALCGILPCRGEITLCGKDAKKLSARQIARLSRYIPQKSGISLDISVLDVVLMGFNPQLGLLESPAQAMKSEALSALDSVGLAHRARENFQALSEGQKQMCMLARAMLLTHGVLFLDEPESALDFSGRYKLLGMIRDWVEERQSAALVTLHDPQLAINTCDTLLLMQDGILTGVLHPAEDSQSKIETQLSRIYGSLSVHRCLTRTGKPQFVLLKEE